MLDRLRSTRIGYLLAAGTAAGVGMLRLALSDLPGDTTVYLPFIVPVLLAGWYGGLKPGLLATALGAVLGVNLFSPRHGTLWIDHPGAVVELLLFLGIGVTVSFLCEALHTARDRLVSQHRELGPEVHEGKQAELKRSEVQLRERAEEVEKLMNIMPVGVWLSRDPDCKVITGNRAGYALLRMPEGSNLSKSAPAADRPAHFRVYHEGREVLPHELPMQYAAAHGVEVRGFEEDIVFEDGSVVHAYGSASPLWDEQGKVRGCVAAFMDVSELTRLRDELRRRAEELAHADRRKDEFLATLAHELRNPLAPLRNAVELLRRADGKDALAEQAQRIMERQLGQMVRLIDDLLDISRITRGILQLRTEHIDLAAAMLSAVEASRPLIELFGHELTVTLPQEPAFLHADLTRLAQVFSNLLNNAAKYTRPGGHIRLTAGRQGGEVVVSVRDTGIGIAADHLPHLFDTFSQAVPALERSQGGLGIGLSLVRSLVELHGGNVEARSEGPGLGSEFIVRLPAVGPPAQTPREPDEVSDTPRHGPRCRILVVDDNRDAADSLAMLLRLRGHDLHMAHDGLEAVQTAAMVRPDVILLDIGLPGMNGYEAARHIRAQPWGKTLVVIALTGWGQEEDKRRALEAGCDLHLTKPVEPAVLEKLLDGLPPAPSMP